MDLLSDTPSPATELRSREDHGDGDLIDLVTGYEGWSPMPSPNLTSGFENKNTNATTTETEENEDSDGEISVEGYDDFSTTKGSSDWIVAHSEYPDTPPMQSTEVQGLDVQRADSPLKLESVYEMENEMVLDTQLGHGDATEDVEMSDESSLFIENPQTKDDGASEVTVIYSPLPKPGDESLQAPEHGPDSSETGSGNAEDSDGEVRVPDNASDITSFRVSVLSSSEIVTVMSEGGSDDLVQSDEQESEVVDSDSQNFENHRPVKRQIGEDSLPTIQEETENQAGTLQMNNMEIISKYDGLKNVKSLSLSGVSNLEDLSARLHTLSSTDSTVSPRRKRQQTMLEAATSNRIDHNSDLKGGNSTGGSNNISNSSSPQSETEAQVTVKKTVRFDVPGLETFPGYKDPFIGWEPEDTSNTSSAAEWVKIERKAVEPEMLINPEDGSRVALPSNLVERKKVSIVALPRIKKHAYSYNLGSPVVVFSPYRRHLSRKSPSHI